MKIVSESFLQEFHRKNPSCSSNAFVSGFADNGLNSYALLVDSLKEKRGPLLDLACGDGFLLKMFSEQRGSADQLFGVDMSLGELQVAWEQKDLLRTHILRGNARELPFADESFEAVTCHMAFMLMPRADEIVAEIQRVLQTEGRFLAILPRGRLQDDPISIYRDWMSKNIPAEKLGSLMALGDERVGSEEGLRSLFSDFADLTLESFDMHYHLTPEQLTANFSTFYASALLDDNGRERMKKELLQAYRALGQERLHHVFPIYRLMARK